jgi:hypothetical protein
VSNDDRAASSLEIEGYSLSDRGRERVADLVDACVEVVIPACEHETHGAARELAVEGVRTDSLALALGLRMDGWT